ncbi:MAG TPA: hypothetical protein VLT45_24640 [Kofleriaceae bacterium]|nr:hypothetical protein [Kofleriaceae bacterium]
MPRLTPALVARKLEASGAVKPATLVRLTPGTRTPGALSAGTNPTSTSYPCRGFATRTTRTTINGTLVEASDRVIALLAASLQGQVPRDGDQVTIESVTTRIVAVERDPFAAVYTCLTRK